MDMMDDKVLGIVATYIIQSGESNTPFFAYIVWKAKVLRNWKYVVSTDLNDGMYYELTYNGEKKEWYLDVYEKVENKVIREGEVGSYQGRSGDLL